MKTLAEIDRSLLFSVNLWGQKALDPIAIFISSDGLWWGVAAVLAVIILYLRKLRWFQMGVAMMLALGISDLVSARALKPVFHRRRPCYQFYELRFPIPGCGSYNSFPSNHASNSMASAAVVAVSAPLPLGLFAIGVACLVGLSRVYLGVHFPGDVLGGFFVGAVIGIAVGLALRRPWKRFRGKLFT